MKKVQESPRERFQYCVMYRDDIQHIIDALAMDTESPIKIQSHGELAANSDDLFEFLGDEGKTNLEMSSPYPGVSLSALDSAVIVWSSDMSDANVAKFHRVITIVKSTVRGKRWYERFAFAVGLMAVTWAGILLASLAKSNALQIGGLVACICGLTGVMLFGRFGKTHTRFYGVRRSQQPSFLKRNRDAIAVGLITGTAGTLLGAVGAFVTQHFSK